MNLLQINPATVLDFMIAIEYNCLSPKSYSRASFPSQAPGGTMLFAWMFSLIQLLCSVHSCSLFLNCFMLEPHNPGGGACLSHVTIT